eukprot:164770-Pleurochrysis_carterae.AAC.1
MKLPDGMDENSVEGLKAKLALAMEYGHKMRRAVLAPLDPNQVPGLMVARAAPVKKRVRTNSRIEMSEGGSATMRELHERRVQQSAAHAAEEVRICLALLNYGVTAICYGAARSGRQGDPSWTTHAFIWR